MLDKKIDQLRKIESSIAVMEDKIKNLDQEIVLLKLQLKNTYSIFDIDMLDIKLTEISKEIDDLYGVLKSSNLLE